MNKSFITDIEKMRDFFELSKGEFLSSYSYLQEDDYQDTLKELYRLLKPLVTDEDGIILCEHLINGYTED